MSLLDLSARELLERFASTDPTPGGGSAAALSGATAAALVAMVCGMPKTRSGSAEERARLDTGLGWAREARERLERLVQEDSAAYDAVMAAYRLPKQTDAEKASRKEAIAAALAGASEAPIRTAEACLVVLRAAAQAAAHGNPNALSDARTGAAMAWAGLVGAAENVRVNAASQGEAGRAFLEKAEALAQEGRAQAIAAGIPL